MPVSLFIILIPAVFAIYCASHYGGMTEEGQAWIILMIFNVILAFGIWLRITEVSKAKKGKDDAA